MRKSNHSASAQGPRIRSTTVICVRRNGAVVMAADGQVTMSDHVVKHSAKKIRRLYQDKILAGFAGSTADAFNLFNQTNLNIGSIQTNINQTNFGSITSALGSRTVQMQARFSF